MPKHQSGLSIDTTPISFQWVGPVALLANLLAGTLASGVIRRDDSMTSTVLKAACALAPLVAIAGVITLFPVMIGNVIK